MGNHSENAKMTRAIRRNPRRVLLLASIAHGGSFYPFACVILFLKKAGASIRCFQALQFVSRKVPRVCKAFLEFRFGAEKLRVRQACIFKSILQEYQLTCNFFLRLFDSSLSVQSFTCAVFSTRGILIMAFNIFMRRLKVAGMQKCHTTNTGNSICQIINDLTYAMFAFLSKKVAMHDKTFFALF